MEQETKYFLVNAVRRRHTRAQRAQSATRHRFTQFVLGGSVRLVRGRPCQTPLTGAQIRAHFNELREKQNAGLVEVHVGSPEGPLYNFGDVDEMSPPQAAPEKEPEAQELEKEFESEEEEEEEEGEDTTEESTVDETLMEKPNYASMKKSELVAHVAELTGDDPATLQRLTRNQLLEVLS